VILRYFHQSVLALAGIDERRRASNCKSSQREQRNAAELLVKMPAGGAVAALRHEDFGMSRFRGN
jgi:hypothetical protein